MKRYLTAGDFPEGTPLNRFLAWNEARLQRDRRYVVARDIHRLLDRFGGTEAAVETCVAHLTQSPVIAWRWFRWMRLRPGAAEPVPASPAASAARTLIEALRAACGNSDMAAHAAVFRAFEALEALVGLDRLAATRPSIGPSRLSPGPRRILVIKLSALGDFIQALGPAAALRRHHADDRITLLTTRPYAEFARQTGYFDEILIDRRPRLFDLPGWLTLRGSLRAGRFDRVYDLQTSDRSSFYAWLLRPGQRPQWSGIARGCSHPHADLDRDAGHTIDKQAEQLLMAGVFPVPLPRCPVPVQALPPALAGRDFVLLIPGSSPRHLAKRWPPAHYGVLAGRLHAAGYVPVVLGAPNEQAIAATIIATCPAAIDLTGKTDLAALAGLAAQAAFTIGNDTGVTHIAAAGGNPVVVLFSRASEPARCAPRGGSVTVLSRPVLADLAIETVFDAAQAAVGNRKDEAVAVRSGL
ncbi:MAG: glycosyltransferase family 9 protein [Aliidongia sp.]